MGDTEENVVEAAAADTGAGEENTNGTNGTERKGRGKRPPRNPDEPMVLMEKVPQPNKEEYENNKAALEKGIVAIQAKIDGFSAVYDKHHAVRTKAQQDKKDVIKKLKQFREQRDALFKEIQSFQDNIGKIEGEKKVRREKADKLRKDLRYFSVEEIDATVKDIERKLETTTMPLAREKQLIQEIKTLKSQRDLVKQYQQAEKEAKEAVSAPKELFKQREDKRAELKSLKDEEGRHEETLKQLKAAEKAANDAITAMYDERNVAYEEQREMRRSIKKLDNEYEKAERLFQRWSKQQKYLRFLQQKAERDAYYDEQRKRREEEEKEASSRHPYEVEMALCESLIAYMKRLAPQDEEKEQPAKEEKQEAPKFKREGNNKFFQGVVLTKAVETNYGGIVEPKKDNKKKKKKAKVVLTHVPDIFVQFETLGLRPPLDSSAVATSLTELTAKLEYFKTAPPKEKKKKEKTAKETKAAKEEEEADKQDESDRKKAGVEADKLEDQEQAARVHEVEEAEAETRKERQRARKMSVALVEEERKRLENEAHEVEEAEKRERAKNRKMSIDMMEQERQRRLAEIAAVAQESQQERRKSIAQADELMELERKEQMVDEERVLSEKRRATSSHDVPASVAEEGNNSDDESIPVLVAHD